MHNHLMYHLDVAASPNNIYIKMIEITLLLKKSSI